MLNRSSVIVRSEQPFLDWVNSYDGTRISPLEVDRDQTVYLIPEYLKDLDAHQVLKSGSSGCSWNGSPWNSTQW
jgi:hypothetical protein